MANLYIYKADYKRAEQHALKGLEIAELNNFKKEIGDNCLVLTTIYTKIDSTEKANFYQAKFDSIQASLNPIAAAPDASLIQNDEQAPAPKERMNGFLQAIILCTPVILFVLFMGRPS
ncbi:MAG: hypothetical protein IPO32_11500 [Crocinitomicaceae bacterium]|nr:hypothetical protein [Crocinitomicaceae bacterium]